MSDPAVESAAPRRSQLSELWLWGRFVLFFAMHAFVFVGMVTTPFRPEWLALCAVSYVVRMWAVSAGYHRYFSHRSFETSRAFQLVLAVAAQSSNQNGVLWWAARHRHHHSFSDRPEDVHSPVHHGFVRSHLTWFMYPENWTVDEDRVRDLMRYPELVWLQRVPWLPTTVLAAAMVAWLGWPGLLWGYLVPTVLLLHATFTVNSLSHMWGTRPWETGDRSANNPVLGLLTLGEGWHNNHHASPGSTRFGWAWYQIDLTWMGLWVLEKLGIVWNLKAPPPRRRVGA